MGNHLHERDVAFAVAGKVGQVIEGGTLVLRDGVIAAVGAGIYTGNTAWHHHSEDKHLRAWATSLLHTPPEPAGTRQA
jgi:hypothetical protein